MKLSKTLLQAIVVAVTVGAISSSCEKPTADEMKKNTTEKKQSESYPDGCPGCGMG
jgi:hypothetical protein